jgi:5'-3' exoribonuclease 1
MEPFNLPTLDGLHLVEGLCDGVFLGTAALAGFPSLNTLPHTGRLEYHHVNVFQAESRSQSMVVEIENNFAGKKTADIAEMMVGKKTFIGWPFLQEGLVVAVSDELFRHEMRLFGASSERRPAAAPHSPVTLSRWKNSATRIEEVYSKRFAVVTGPVEFLLHVRPLKGMPSGTRIPLLRLSSLLRHGWMDAGLKRLDTGALVKDYEGPDKEVEQAVQLGLQEVISEDPRYLEKDAPPLSVEFPIGSKIIFMGEHAYGVAAQVQSTTETSLSVVLAVCILRSCSIL